MKKTVSVIAVAVALFSFVLLLVIAVRKPAGEQMSEESRNTEVTESETVTEEEHMSETEEVVEEMGPPPAVSIFSWYFELTNQAQLTQLTEPLKEMGITRVYQLMPATRMGEPDTMLMVEQLHRNGIETVVLTGSPSWVKDGSAEFEGLIDSIVLYNQKVVPELQIRKVAVDVEVHNLQEWQNDPVGVLAKYVTFAEQLKLYANANAIEVIQVIPAYYDEIDSALFDLFMQKCCDELSLMNYNRKSADKDIAYEVRKASEYGIPIETVFETMPISETHMVTEDMTYYDSGTDALKQDASYLRSVYGEELGIAYHHYTILYEMCTGERLAEISLPDGVWQEGVQPGNLMLQGDDGSVLQATPYWTADRKERRHLKWLARGVKEDVHYKVVCYDLYTEIYTSGDVVFQVENSGKLHAVLSGQPTEGT